MEKIIEKRNELAKQIYLIKKINVEESVKRANKYISVSVLYEEEWEEAIKRNTQLKKTNVMKSDYSGISIHTDRDGVKWVRVKILDEDFLIAAKDYKEEGETSFYWNKANEIGTFSKKQCHIIVAFINTINDKLKEIGGDPLDSVYWGSAEYSSKYGWYVFFSDGICNFSTKHFPLRVRPCKTFED